MRYINYLLIYLVTYLLPYTAWFTECY